MSEDSRHTAIWVSTVTAPGLRTPSWQLKHPSRPIGVRFDTDTSRRRPRAAGAVDVAGGDDAAVAVVGGVVPRPVDEHDGPVAEADENTMWSPSQASLPRSPDSRTPLGSSVTAAWRPIVAIVPLSR